MYGIYLYLEPVRVRFDVVNTCIVTVTVTVLAWFLACFPALFTAARANWLNSTPCLVSAGCKPLSFWSSCLVMLTPVGWGSSACAAIAGAPSGSALLQRGCKPLRQVTASYFAGAQENHRSIVRTHKQALAIPLRCTSRPGSVNQPVRNARSSVQTSQFYSERMHLAFHMY